VGTSLLSGTKLLRTAGEIVIMSKKLAGKVALVTGASKGIGAGIAKHLAAEGAAVVVNYASSKEGAERVVSKIKANGGKAVAVQADMAKKGDIERLFAEAKKAFGALDILVNNAGIYEFAPLENLTEEFYHKHFNLNVLGLLLASKEAQNILGRRAAASSISAPLPARPHRLPPLFTPPPMRPWTGSPKPWPKKLGPRGIRVNAINPGMIETEGLHTAGMAQSDFRKDDRSANAAWAHWSGGRYCSGGRVPGFFRFCLDHGRDNSRCWRI
jgi:3-oxoacyl-[acyl-carrier protein] reductase